MRFKSIIAASVVATGLMFSVAVPAASMPATDVTEAQLTAARTPADHEAIAGRYDAQAKEAEEVAANHEMMAKAYKTAGAKGTASMASHCTRLVTQYRAAAQEYRALAAEHRAMGKGTAE